MDCVVRLLIYGWIHGTNNLCRVRENRELILGSHDSERIPKYFV